MFIQNRNSALGAGLHIGIPSVRSLAFKRFQRALVGCDLVAVEFAVKTRPIQMHEFADGPVFAGATSLRNGHIGLVGELGQLPVGLRVVLNLRVGEVFQVWSWPDFGPSGLRELPLCTSWRP